MLMTATVAFGSEAPIQVVATTGMVADAVRNVGGERVEVIALMGPGIDPHVYRATEGDVRRLNQADIIFYIGLDNEARMEDVLREIAVRIPTFAVADAIDQSLLLDGEDEDEEFDPHIWFDVSLWKLGVTGIRDTLSEFDPDSADQYLANANRYLQELDELESWIISQVERIPEEKRVMVTAHDAFRYFGRAYDFQVKGLYGISTEDEVGIREVRELARFMVEREIPAIFAETMVPLRSVEAVQAAAQAMDYEVAIGGELYSCAIGEPGSPGETYIGMVRSNIDTIVSALLIE